MDKTRSTMKERKRDRITALAILFSSLLVIFVIIPLQIKYDINYEIIGPKPDFFPLLSTWIIVILAVWLFGLTFSKTKGQKGSDIQERKLKKKEEWEAYKCLLLCVVYIIAMKFIGFTLSTIAAIACLFLQQGIKKPKKIILYSLIYSVLVFLLFRYAMKVYFPVGLIFEYFQ